MTPWIEAMRLRTLPVSIAGVIAGTGCAIYNGAFRAVPFVICLLFAVMAQIDSNFANEYFDYKNGLDRQGREGFRRGVTEGDISPRAMLGATIGLLVITCLTGLSLIWFGGWKLIFVGVAVAIFALAYSAGPWPLSHHGLGEAAVVVFFGLVPVIFTDYVQTGNMTNLGSLSFPIGLAIGLMGANVMIVNNYRDYYDDLKLGKRTSAVILGRNKMRLVYLANGFVAIALIIWVTIGRRPLLWQAGSLVYANLHYMIWNRMGQSEGHELNPLLGKTAVLMFGVAVWLLVMLAG